MASTLATRRDFLAKSTLLTAGAVAAPAFVPALAQEKKGEEVEVSPTEDLMRGTGC